MSIMTRSGARNYLTQKGWSLCVENARGSLSFYATRAFADPTDLEWDAIEHLSNEFDCDIIWVGESRAVCEPVWIGTDRPLRQPHHGCPAF